MEKLLYIVEKCNVSDTDTGECIDSEILTASFDEDIWNLLM